MNILNDAVTERAVVGWTSTRVAMEEDIMFLLPELCFSGITDR